MVVGIMPESNLPLIHRHKVLSILAFVHINIFSFPADNLACGPRIAGHHRVLDYFEILRTFISRVVEFMTDLKQGKATRCTK
jgi:hypothetical protein